LATGYRSDFRPKKEWLEEDGIATQLEAVELVRADMDQLCTAFCAALREAGVDSRIQPPRNWATGVGPNFKGDINCLSSNLDEPVVVTFGDVVQCSGEGRFGILSGDDIAFRAATELPAVAALVFAVGEVEGLLTAPPGAENSELIESWWPEQHYIGRHSDSSDVTGGIELKVQRAANAALIVPQVWIVDGRHPDRIVKAARGATPRGTRVLASEP
jgi:isopentenyl phosphate kinase